jgi:hypothetical protein
VKTMTTKGATSNKFLRRETSPDCFDDSSSGPQNQRAFFKCSSRALLYKTEKKKKKDDGCVMLRESYQRATQDCSFQETRRRKKYGERINSLPPVPKARAVFHGVI